MDQGGDGQRLTYAQPKANRFWLGDLGRSKKCVRELKLGFDGLIVILRAGKKQKKGRDERAAS